MTNILRGADSRTKLKDPAESLNSETDVLNQRISKKTRKAALYRPPLRGYGVNLTNPGTEKPRKKVISREETVAKTKGAKVIGQKVGGPGNRGTE